MAWTGGLRFAVMTAVSSLVVAGCLVEPHRATPLGPATALTFVDGRPTDPREPGTQVFEYRHGKEISLGFTVTADRGQSFVLTGLRLDDTKPSVATTLGASVDGRMIPVHLAGGERAVVTVRARLDGCPHQGAETISAVLVDLVNAGRPQTWRLAIDRDLIIRSPVSCRLS